MASSLTFLPGFGFRPPGARLAQQMRVERDGRAFTVIQFVSTPSGTDFTYEITDPHENASCVVPGSGPSLLDPDKVTLREGDREFGDAFATSSGVIAGGVRRTLQARPLPPAVPKLEIHVVSRLFGEWTVPLELPDVRRRDDRIERRMDLERERLDREVQRSRASGEALARVLRRLVVPA